MFDQATGSIDSRHRGFFADSGDARQVWAWSADEERVVYLPEDGVDDAVRRACHEKRLRCSMPDCADPRFIARGGDERRHHFAHRVAHTPHVAATVWRHEAAAMLADWARRYPSANVTVEESDRVSEVRIRSARSGKTVTLAITYDRSYSPRGDAARDPSHQLLLGHTKGLLLPRKQHSTIAGGWGCGQGQLVRSLVAVHHAALAVNPQERLVATLVSQTDAYKAGLSPWAADYPVFCLVEDLDDCTLDEHGLVTPALRRVRAMRAAAEAAEQAAAAERARRQVLWNSADAAVAAAKWSHRSSAADTREAEFHRRAAGKSTEERLALIKEIWLPGLKPKSD